MGKNGKSLTDRAITFAKKIFRPEPYATNTQEGDLTIKTAAKRVGKVAEAKRQAAIKKATSY